MGVNIQTIKDIRLYMAKELKDIYPQQEINSIANIVIMTVINIKKLHQLHNPDQAVTREQAGRIISICKELGTSKPIQYILGETIFYDCIIKVDSSTLIPRPETEELVDIIIKENKDFQGTIFDLCTGSGCIAIALAANIPGSLVTGIDISKGAVRIARENAIANNVSVSFVEGDIFNFDLYSVNKASIIVSNPPYVRNSEKPSMKKNILEFEPQDALFVPDYDPLKFYKGIFSLAEKMLIPGGKIYFEINEAMGKSMIKLFESSGYSQIKIINDMNSKERMIKGTKDV
jgi:release factor glutamine methyltransferase